MVQIKYFICLLIAVFVAETKVFAQDAEKYGGMTWYLKKSVALDSARSQDKQVFLVWGRRTCAYTTGVRDRLTKSPLKPIVSDNYILWFSDCDIYLRNSTEVKDYLSVLPASVTLPATCIIDMYDVTVAHGLRTGPQRADDLQEMLNQYVSNDYITEKTDILKAYVAGNNLIVKNKSVYEDIRVFTVTGSLTDMFHKKEDVITRDLSMYPKGVLIVSGSSGWTQKIVVK